jgi:acetylornithine/succinyldiaminopimelate/putrescine aminotransferase/long-subunit acyl-CoA synthetase (AMP-forming)
LAVHAAATQSGGTATGPTCFADLVFADGDAPWLLGTWGTGRLDLTRRQLAALTLALDTVLAEQGLVPGDTIALIRLPRTSETLLAAAWMALATLGYRVFLPMSLDAQALPGWLDAVGARAVWWGWDEGVTRADQDADRRFAEGLSVGDRPTRCLERDLRLRERLAVPWSPGDDATQVDAIRARGDRACVILTTSGTSGHTRRVTYLQSAWLRSCAAWEAAGLFAPERLGGRGICLLVAHSMGLRAVVNALWTGQPLCVLPPEWFLEAPHRLPALLASMRPEHLTGGPAVFATVLALAEVYPSLKDAGLRGLRCAVAVGAPLDPRVARRVSAALGLPIAVGFGTTETLLVATTLLGGEPGGIGAPLPGVQLRLDPTDDPDAFDLWVSSPYGAAAIDEAPAPAWIRTGDRVSASLRVLGRAGLDFVKDAFGVKIDLAEVRLRYADLGGAPVVVELVAAPMDESPGLAALIFVDGPVDAAAVRAVKSQLEARNDALRAQLDDLVFRHGTLARFALVSGAPPRTAKGTLAAGAWADRYGPALAALCGRWIAGADRAQLDREGASSSAFTRHAGPGVGQLLALGGMDLDFVDAQGDTLVSLRRGERRAILDLVGGFGGNLLGHRHPAVLAAAQEVLTVGGPPLFDQGSAWRAQGALARELAAAYAPHTGRSYVVRCVNTGSEAVEVALAHAWLVARQRLDRAVAAQVRAFGARDPAGVRALQAAVDALPPPRVFAVRGAYHGHSLGARALLDHAAHRGRFAPLLRLETVFLSEDEDPAAAVTASAVDLPWLADDGAGGVRPAPGPWPLAFAAFVEPVSGEGGMRTRDPAWLARLAATGVPVVLDEVQCGLGRTGRLLASPVSAPYLLLAKALGGGVAKIGAVLIDRSVYLDDFDSWYASTFAGDRASATVASAVVRTLVADDVPGRAARVGARLRDGLAAVAASCPAFAGVSGVGLMLGVHLAAPQQPFLLRALVDRERLGWLAAAWLLHARAIRVLPTLSAPLTLRVEPSAYLSDADADRAIAAFADLGAALASGDLVGLFGWILREEAPAVEPPPAIRPVDTRRQAAPPGAVRVGFVHHFAHPEAELVAVAPPLAVASFAARRALYDRVVALCDGHPVEVYATPLVGGRVWLSGELLPLDAAALDAARRSGDLARVVARVQEAVDRAAARGCTVIALGGATSIVTDNGRALLAPPGVRLTSGNSLTAAVGIGRLLGSGDTDGWIGILGASGNIGQAVARALVRPDRWRRAVLIGRDPDRLRALADLPGELICSTDLADLRRCSAIVTATSTAEVLVYPEHLGPGPVRIADLAIPSPIARSVWADPRVTRLRHAGFVPLPTDPDFVQSTQTPPGALFCCAAEAVLAALHPDAVAALPLVGPLDPAALDAFEALARAEGWWPDAG